MNQSHVIDKDAGRTRLKHVQKTRHRLETTAGQNQQGPKDDASSDSGDSLFITQKPAADPVRPARPHRSYTNYSRFTEESEVESASSFQEQPKIPKRKSSLDCTLPSFMFGFLSGKGVLPAQKNRILHSFATRGFFKCLGEFGRETSLPTGDTDEENISPLSEEEEESSHVEGFRVVNKRCFATELKARISQREGEKRKDADLVGEETSGEKGLESKEKTAVEASASTEEQPRRPVASSRHTEPSSTDQGKKMKEAPGSQEVCGDNGGDVCEAATADGDRESRDEGGRGETADTRGSQTPPHGDDERLCISKTGTKRKGRKEKRQAHASVEQRGQEQPEDPGVPESEAVGAEPQAADDAECMEMSLCEDQKEKRKKRREKKKKKKTVKMATEECLESDSVMSQDGNKKNDDGDDVSRAEESSVGTFSGGERVKVKRKKNKRISSAGEREEPNGTTGQSEESGKSPGKGSTLATEDESCRPEGEERVKKKHRSSPGETEEVTEEQLSDTATTLKRKSRKKKKEKPARDGEEAEPAKKKRREITTDTSEDLERSRKEKRRASSFLCADAVEKDVQTPGGRVPDEGSDTQSAEIGGSSERSVRRVKKKKKKKKRNCEDAADGGAEGSEDGQGAMGGSRCAAEVSPPGRGFDGKAEASPSGRSVRKKHGKSKRVLYNPAEDLLE